MHARLRADGEAFRGEPRGHAPERPARASRLRWAAPAAAAAAVVAIAAGTALLHGGKDAPAPAAGDPPITDPYPAPAAAAGRQVFAVIPNGPGAADDETVPATVITDDAATGQSLLVYRRGDQNCLRWQGPRSGSTTCAAPDGDVTVDAAGPAVDVTGTAKSAPAAWGRVPTAATTVIITAADGTSTRAHAVNGTPYGANFYLAAFDVGRHPLSSVAAYGPEGHVIRAWRAQPVTPTAGLPELGRIPIPASVRAAVPGDPRVPRPGASVDLLAKATDGAATAGFVGWVRGGTFCWARYVSAPSFGQAPAEPASCGPISQTLNRLGFSRSLGLVADGQLKQLVWGMAPAGTATVSLSAPGKPTVTAAAYDGGAAWNHSRFFLATWLAKTRVTVTALATNGKKIAVRSG
jgi:hypothetical protein